MTPGPHNEPEREKDKGEPSGDLSPLADQYFNPPSNPESADLSSLSAGTSTSGAPGSTIDDALSEAFSHRPAKLSETEAGNLEMYETVYAPFVESAHLVVGESGEIEYGDIAVRHAGPFRSKDGMILQWSEFVDRETGESLVPDLKLIKKGPLDRLDDIVLAERFEGDTVRMFRKMVLTPSGYRHHIEVLMNEITLQEALDHFFTTVVAEKNGRDPEVPVQYSCVRDFIDYAVRDNLHERVLERYKNYDEDERGELFYDLLATGFGRVQDAAISNSTNGDIAVTIVTTMPGPDCDPELPGRQTVITYGVRLSNIGGLVLSEDAVEDR